jgi:hypothetical protein
MVVRFSVEVAAWLTSLTMTPARCWNRVQLSVDVAAAHDGAIITQTAAPVRNCETGAAD